MTKQWQPNWNNGNPPPTEGWYELQCLEYGINSMYRYWDGDIWRVSGPPESPVENNGKARVSGFADYNGPLKFKRNFI